MTIIEYPPRCLVALLLVVLLLPAGCRGAGTAADDGGRVLDDAARQLDVISQGTAQEKDLSGAAVDVLSNTPDVLELAVEYCNHPSSETAREDYTFATLGMPDAPPVDQVCSYLETE